MKCLLCEFNIFPITPRGCCCSHSGYLLPLDVENNSARTKQSPKRSVKRKKGKHSTRKKCVFYFRLINFNGQPGSYNNEIIVASKNILENVRKKLRLKHSHRSYIYLFLLNVFVRNAPARFVQTYLLGSVPFSKVKTA